MPIPYSERIRFSIWITRQALTVINAATRKPAANTVLEPNAAKPL